MKLDAFRRTSGRSYATIAALLGCTLAVVAGRSQETPDSEGVAAVSAVVSSDPGADGASAQGGCNYYDDGSVMDVLVVYTARARLQNSSNDIDAYIQAHVDTMNEILSNSQAFPRIQVVHSEEVVYDEGVCTCNEPPSGVNNDTTMDRLLDPNDGYLDNVPGLRDSHHADLVLMITSCVNCGGVAACNRGEQYILQQEGGFAAVSSDWPIAFPWGAAHELGHVLGCGHNRDADYIGPGLPRNCSAYPYSYGFDFIGDSGEWNSTVMSYGPTLCGATAIGSSCKLYNHNSDCPSGQSCQHLPPPKIPYFSNPEVFFDGRPTGVPIGDPNAANNALTINNAAFTVANFRQRPGNIWVDFAYSGTESGCFERPYNTLSEGVGHVPDNGTLIFKAGSTPATDTIAKRVTLKAYGGTVRIGG